MNSTIHHRSKTTTATKQPRITGIYYFLKLKQKNTNIMWIIKVHTKLACLFAALFLHHLIILRNNETVKWHTYWQKPWRRKRARCNQPVITMHFFITAVLVMAKLDKGGFFCILMAPKVGVRKTEVHGSADWIVFVSFHFSAFLKSSCQIGNVKLVFLKPLTNNILM